MFLITLNIQKVVAYQNLNIMRHRNFSVFFPTLLMNFPRLLLYQCFKTLSECISLNSVTELPRNLMGSMEFKLFLLCVVHCSVFKIFSSLKNDSSDAFEQEAHRQILITSFTADHSFGVLALEKNLVPKLALVNVQDRNKLAQILHFRCTRQRHPPLSRL